MKSMETMTVPRIPTHDLQAALESELSSYFGTKQRIQKLRRRLSAYSSSCRIENLNVQLDRGRPLGLVFKDLNPAALTPGAREIRPQFLYDPRREIETYRNILSPGRLGTPICYGAIATTLSERDWLFLERVQGPLLWQLGRIAHWEEAARWLARFHAEFQGHSSLSRLASQTSLLHYDEAYLRVWLTRAELLLGRRHAGEVTETWQRFCRLVDRYDRLIRHIRDLPATVIHGEFYPSNIIMREGEQARQVCPVDWEVAAVGPGLMDLGALTAGDWSESQKKTLVAAYHQALPPSKGWPPSLPEMLEAVDWCQLHLCVQWLGWAPDWLPPGGQARNWLWEAFCLADKLGL
jgi:hypothetical protein